MAAITERLPALVNLIGTEIGLSAWKLIDQSMVDAASELTGDAGPIHDDPIEAALIAPFGGTIVQGFLMLSHLTGFAKSVAVPDQGVIYRLNYGFDRVRFITPVPTGTRIRGRFALATLAAKGADGALLTMKATIEAEGIDQPAVVADWLAYLALEPVAAE